MQEGHLVELLLLEHQRDVLDDEHRQVHADAEDDFREHGVHVGVPEAEPRAQRLAELHGQDEHGARVAEEAHYDRQVDDGHQGLDLEYVAQKAGEERAGAQSDDRQVEGDVQAEGEVVVEAGHAQAVPEHHAGCDSAPEHEQDGNRQPQHKLGQAATLDAFRPQGLIDRFSHGCLLR